MSNWFTQDLNGKRIFALSIFLSEKQNQFFGHFRRIQIPWFVIVIGVVLLTLSSGVGFYSGLLNSFAFQMVMLFVGLVMISLFGFLVYFYRYQKSYVYFLPLCLLGIRWLFFIFINTGLTSNSFFTIPIDSFNFLFNSDFKENLVLSQLSVLKQKQSMVLNFLLDLISMSFVILFFLLNREYWKRIIRNFARRPVLFFGFILIFLTSILFIYYDGLPNKTDSEQSQNQQALLDLYSSSSHWGRFFFFLKVVLIAPLWEEIIYRYLPGTFFDQNEHFLFLIFFGTIWFAGSHIKIEWNDSDVSIWKQIFSAKTLPYFLSGFFYIWIYWSTAYSLPYTMAAHSLNNIAVFTHTFPLFPFSAMLLNFL